MVDLLSDSRSLPRTLSKKGQRPSANQSELATKASGFGHLRLTNARRRYTLNCKGNSACFVATEFPDGASAAQGLHRFRRTASLARTADTRGMTVSRKSPPHRAADS